MNLFPLVISILATVLQPWQDASHNEENRLPMRATVENSYQKLSLDGEWKFRWYQSPSERSTDFFKPGTDDSDWGVMPVPGIWELNGYGDPLYVNIGYAWRGHYTNNPPFPPEDHNYVGQYRRSFVLDPAWKGRRIVLTVGSATSNIRVWVNGKPAGYSEDSKLPASFDISNLVRFNSPNLFAFEIFRWCDGTYLEDQDFWRLCGIARETFLTAEPRKRVEDISVRASMDGSYSVNTVLEGVKEVKLLMSGPGMEEREVAADGKIDSPALWSAETPNLYTLKALWTDEQKQQQWVRLNFGFREVKVENGQLLVNGAPVLIKGVNRHELSATGGYVVSHAEMERDIRIMKSLNINAVRTCHYPNDSYWFELCNRYGLYVIGEANVESHAIRKTMASNPDYAAAHMERVSRMVKRDLNQPCIIIWSLGNEAGYGPNFTACYDWLKAFDPTRPVQYEQARKNYATDIFCPMYYGYEDCEKYCQSNPSRPLIQCEYAHAMGNSMGGFKEYWDLIRKYPNYQGGCIWDFADQALLWPCDPSSGTDHIYIFGGDMNDYDPGDTSFNCNGVVAADRSLHPHAWEVWHQYQNLWASAGSGCGKLSVYNENFFTGTDNYILRWTVQSDGVLVREGIVPDFSIAPGCSEELDLGFSEAELDALEGELFLNVSFELKERKGGLLPAGTVVAANQLPLRPASYVQRPAQLRSRSVSIGFDEKTGALTSYIVAGRELLKAPLLPCFGRALTENDLGAKMDKWMGGWLWPELTLVSSSPLENGGAAMEWQVGSFARVSMTVALLADGSLKVSQKLHSVAAEVPPLFRFGLEFAMPGEFSNLEFYGAGPYETYIDRKSSANIGLYRQRVEDQYHWGYARPQESGTHCDLSFIRITDDGGVGVEIASPVLFSASALPLSRADIDLSITGGGRSDGGDQRHSLELLSKACIGCRSLGGTYVNVDLVQMGLGCVTSWRTTPRKEYMLPAREYEFEFTIKPLI
ncbi:MAG: DUF4981 domain-containing protein [Bacteroidales bacterium]|nr:DUF4981 domain-containing protein [Bacteroidales bacterium]